MTFKFLFCIIFAINSFKVVHFLTKWKHFRKWTQATNLLIKMHLSDKTLGNSDDNHSNGTKLTSFPSKLLLTILDRVPIGQLVVTVPLISKQFAQLATIARGRRRSLSLICGTSNCSPEWSPFCLSGSIAATQSTSFVAPQNRVHTLTLPRITQLSPKLCTHLVCTFPRIRSLQLGAIALTTAQLDESITDTLLTSWCTQLCALKLTLWFNDSQLIRHPHHPTVPPAAPHEIARALCRMIESTINRTTQLRKLILISSGQLDDDDNATVPQIELRIIGQLSEFFYFFQSASAIHNSLIKYGANLANENMNKQIGIAASITNEDELRRIILPVNSSRISTEFSQLASCITYLNINTIEFAFEQLDNFLLCLPNLAGLTVSWPTNRPLVQLIRALISSTKVNSNLTYLCLRIRQPPPHQFRLMFDTSPLDLAALTTTSNDSLFQLCSITKLCLDFSSIKHTDYRLFKFGFIFPHLKSVYLLNCCWTCTICAIRPSDFLLEHSIYRAKRAGCVKWITAYLRDTYPHMNAATFACISISQLKLIEIDF